MLCQAQTEPGTSVKLSTVISVSGVLSSAADTACQKEKTLEHKFYLFLHPS